MNTTNQKQTNKDVVDCGRPRNQPRQRRLFPDIPETREVRIERIFSGSLSRELRKASEIIFDYDLATKIAKGE